MAGPSSDNRWAGPAVIVAGLLFLAAGAALAAYSVDTPSLYHLIDSAAGDVTAHRPAFLTPQWVESHAWPIRLIGLVIAAAGAGLIALRRQSATRVASGFASLRDSARRHRRDVRARIRETPRIELAALAAIVAGAVAIRLVFLDDPMRYDETYTFQEFASQPLAVGISLYPDQNNHVLNTVLSHFSIQIFGTAAWAIRLPAFLAGCAVVPAAYVAGRSLFRDHGAALIGAALVAVSSPLIEYSANARGYSLSVLAFLILLALGRSLAARGDALLWLLFTAVAALGLWAVPTTAFALATVAIWLGAETLLERRTQGLRALLGLVVALAVAALLTLILYSPLLALGAAGLSNNQDYATSLGTVAVDVWHHWMRDVPLAIELLLAAGFALALVLHRRVATTRLPPIAAAVPVVLLAFAAGRLVQYPRAWLFLAPLFMLTAGAGIAWAVREGMARVRSREARPPTVAAPAVAALVLGVAVAIAGLTNPAIRQQNEGQDAPALTAWLGTELKRHGGHVVTVTPFNYILKYYYFPRHGLSGDYVVGELDAAAAAAGVYAVVPGGKTVGQLTGDEAFKPGEGLGFQPVPGLKEAFAPGVRLARTYRTARVYTNR